MTTAIDLLSNHNPDRVVFKWNQINLRTTAFGHITNYNNNSNVKKNNCKHIIRQKKIKIKTIIRKPNKFNFHTVLMLNSCVQNWEILTFQSEKSTLSGLSKGKVGATWLCISIWPPLKSTVERLSENVFILQHKHVWVYFKSMLHVPPAASNWTN